MVRLAAGRMRFAMPMELESRDACAASAGGVNCVMSVSTSAGTARWSSFAEAIDS